MVAQVVAVTPSPSPPVARQPRPGHFHLGAFGGHSFATGHYLINDLGTTVGGWAAYTFGLSRIALGVEALHQFGEAKDVYSGGDHLGTVASTNLYLGGTFGFGLTAGPFTFRPYFLFGMMSETIKCASALARGCDAAETTSRHGVVGHGLGFHFHASVIEFGVDGRLLYVVDRGVTGAVLGTLGVRIPN